jgi:hypothetical protein
MKNYDIDFKSLIRWLLPAIIPMVFFAIYIGWSLQISSTIADHMRN